jgi:glycosyltransferase involved in cell wall biosynthesis
VILDLDTNFELMPVGHPAYPTMGLGTPASAKAYTASMLLADRICASNEVLAESLRLNGYPVDVIPDGWNRANELWNKPAPHRSTLNLGWVGLPGQVEDITEIRRIVVRVMHEFSQVRLIVVGAPQAYQLFESLPETRRLFLPAVNLEDYPYLLGQIDVLMAPLRNTPFNQNQSDRQLMEAGIRRIPWVASPIPAFTSWGEGGLLARAPEEWHTHLRQLVLEPKLRSSLGDAGRRKAEGREMSRLGRSWLDMIADVVSSKVEI